MYFLNDLFFYFCRSRSLTDIEKENIHSDLQHAPSDPSINRVHRNTSDPTSHIFRTRYDAMCRLTCKKGGGGRKGKERLDLQVSRDFTLNKI